MKNLWNDGDADRATARGAEEGVGEDLAALRGRGR